MRNPFRRSLPAATASDVTHLAVVSLLTTCGFQPRPYRTQPDRVDYINAWGGTQLASWHRSKVGTYFLYDTDDFPLPIAPPAATNTTSRTGAEIQAVFVSLQALASDIEVPAQHIAAALALYRNTWRIRPADTAFPDLLRLMAASDVPLEHLMRMVGQGLSFEELLEAGRVRGISYAVMSNTLRLHGETRDTQPDTGAFMALLGMMRTSTLSWSTFDRMLARRFTYTEILRLGALHENLVNDLLTVA